MTIRRKFDKFMEHYCDDQGQGLRASMQAVWRGPLDPRGIRQGQATVCQSGVLYAKGYFAGHRPGDIRAMTAWRLLAVFGVTSTIALSGCTSGGGGVAVTLDPASNGQLSQSNVSCSQNGSEFAAGGTLSNVTKGLPLLSSAALTVYDTGGKELGTKESGSDLIQPGYAFNWRVSASVGSAQVGQCTVSFTAIPPP